jgi:hypothetical protein
VDHVSIASGNRPYVQLRQSHSNGPKLNRLSHHWLAIN